MCTDAAGELVGLEESSCTAAGHTWHTGVKVGCALLHLVGPPDGDEATLVPRGWPYYSAMLMGDWKL